MGFSRQEYWSGLPFPSPGDLPDPGIEPRFPTFQADALTSEPPGKPLVSGILLKIYFNICLTWKNNQEVSIHKCKQWVFPDSAAVKNLQEMQKMRVRSLDQEDPLEKDMATHSSILAWEIPWTEEPGGLQSMRSKDLDMT